MTDIFYSAIGEIPTAEFLSANLPKGLATGSDKYKDPAARAQSVAVRCLLWYALTAWQGKCNATPTQLSGNSHISNLPPLSKDSRNALSTALSRDCGNAMLSFSSEGKPMLSELPLFVSLSHSQSYVAVALGDTPCGVDTEDETAIRRPHQLAKRFLDEESQKTVAEAENPALAFALAFTRLEATLKQKEGITLPFAKDCLDPLYYSTVLPLPNHKQAVLTAVGNPPFQYHEVKMQDILAALSSLPTSR